MEDGRVTCDHQGCIAIARVPIGLRQLLAIPTISAVGWLFVVSNEGGAHYCPTHAAEHLRAIRSGVRFAPPRRLKIKHSA